MRTVAQVSARAVGGCDKAKATVTGPGLSLPPPQSGYRLPLKRRHFT